MSERRLLKGTQMDKESFIAAVMCLIVFVVVIVLTATVTSIETEQKVVNQLCQKQQYDFVKLRYIE